MNKLKSICLVTFLVASACGANPNNRKQNQNQQSNSLKPSEWLSPAQLEQMPSLDEISYQRLESLPAEEGAKLIEQIYHVAQINHNLSPSYVPGPSNVPVYIMGANGQNVSTNLNMLATTAKQQPNFGSQEVTIFITGLPRTSRASAKATRKLVQAYLQRYNGQQQQQNQQQKGQDYDNTEQNNARTSSEENSDEQQQYPRPASGNLVVIDLGATLTNFKRWALLDTEQTGAMIGKSIVQLTNQANTPPEIMHVVAQGIAAHAAGAAGRQYTRSTGRQLRRISALDPTKLFASDPNTMPGLARGDAEFVDAIHTSAHGMGTRMRVGNVDFYPNGPAATVPGANNAVEAAMRATRYFAESVRPGNERNFPAVAANSMEQYQQNNGHGKRAYMGIDTDYDMEGDYMLEVNPSSPFGKRTPATKQNTYHGVHKASRNSQRNNQDYD